jgi:hypothetical protein
MKIRHQKPAKVKRRKQPTTARSRTATNDNLKRTLVESRRELDEALERQSATNEVLRVKWARREPNAIQRVDRILASANLTMDAVMAQTMADQLAVIESIDRLIAIAEVRRDAVLHEIERHRASFALVMRQTVNQLEHREDRALEASKLTAAKDAA